MDGVFEGLERMGFECLEEVNLFEALKTEQPTNTKKITKDVNIEDILYDKYYTCPICQNKFKAKAIRTGKNRLVSTDLDLKANYEIVNPSIYQTIVCESCGYAALNRNFNVITKSQIKCIKEQICAKYKLYHYPVILGTEEGILRLKLALLNSYARKSTDGEKAYICLKIAWLYRDLQDELNETMFLKYALKGFENAYYTERFPIFELGEITTAYIIASLYRRIGKESKALQWVSFVIMSNNIPLRLKTKALHLRSIIKEEASGK